MPRGLTYEERRLLERLKRKHQGHSEDELIAAILGGTVAALSDSAILGSVVGTALGANPITAIGSSVIGDILGGGGLFD